MNLWQWLADLFRPKHRPSPKPAPPPQPPSSTDLVTLHNQFRVAHGLHVLVEDARLDAAAQAHADDMAVHDNLDHVGSDGSDEQVRILRTGYDFGATAENIAWGDMINSQVMGLWENSPKHHANILGPYANIGTGRNGKYWCVVFANPA